MSCSDIEKRDSLRESQVSCGQVKHSCLHQTRRRSERTQPDVGQACSAIEFQTPPTRQRFVRGRDSERGVV